jgi:hypothetical protein
LVQWSVTANEEKSWGRMSSRASSRCKLLGLLLEVWSGWGELLQAVTIRLWNVESFFDDNYFHSQLPLLQYLAWKSPFLT